MDANKKVERIKILDKEIEELDKRLSEELNKPLKKNESFENFNSRVEPIQDQLSALSREKRLLVDDYTLSPLSKYGDVMSLKDFVGACKTGMFIDYDGHGYYVKDNQETDLLIMPSDVIKNKYRKDFDTIIWFNK